MTTNDPTHRSWQDSATFRWDGHDEHRCVVLVEGEVDVSNADLLVDVVQDYVDGFQSPTLVIDLSRVRFMDSTGFHRLFTCRAHAEDAGRTLTLRAPSPQVSRLFEVLQVSHLFHIE
jgi:stage II sporulation protein AA (anti-sigma F factor antagonist)